ncbi:phytoene dehydrogenase [Longilinea arvoryzae]|uniref:Phytoene dehydrogenase n=1 Tax=Longilinea arvoryzae TaxID=360412 RepID=A0A0K8MZE9_9CHLR|nr:NAD(P)/FAD-dependent oxidoreductase [Longilinea arvoryzae]GAP16012.1 phytoene dehydrogenase [Longilinea arvoryzae]
MQDKSILIIGAGFAGLAAGIYAQMNGYRSQIYEMHTLPGGLCTAWKRKGYTIDGCIHWLVGSSPQSASNRIWREVGVAQGREFVNADEYMRYEGADGRTVIFYSNIDRLEQHLIALSPKDEAVIREFTRAVRLGIALDQQPTDQDAPLVKLGKAIRLGWTFLTCRKDLMRWMNTSTDQFVERIQDPLLREAFKSTWPSNFSMIFMAFTFSYLSDQNAGYPIGGSLPMSQALEQRYLGLGGQIHYSQRVEKILVEHDRAVGIRLADGSEVRAGRVISAADGHATIFDMLDGRYTDEKVREPYEKWPVFPSLVYVGLGVNRTFADEPKTVSGISFPLRQPQEIGGEQVERIDAHIFNQDPTLAPPGKTALTVMLTADYAYWKELGRDPAAYTEKKDQIARQIVAALEERFPGIGGQIEMVDVATPLTFERYTGNWKGSFEGFMITPENANVILKPMSQRLPGLENFYMCGQWVEPGGGLPTGIMSGRRLLQAVCKEDNQRFISRAD